MSSVEGHIARMCVIMWAYVTINLACLRKQTLQSAASCSCLESKPSTCHWLLVISLPSGPQHSKDWFWLIFTGFQWFYCWSQVWSSTLPTRQTQDRGMSHTHQAQDKGMSCLTSMSSAVLLSQDLRQYTKIHKAWHGRKIADLSPFSCLYHSLLLFTITQISSSMQCPQNIVRNWFGCSSNVFRGRAHRKDVRHHVGICHYQFCLPPKTDDTVCCKLLLSRV